MVQKVLAELEKGGTREVDLWVDMSRTPARALYESCGFEKMEEVEDYYGIGRTGMRMRLAM